MSDPRILFAAERTLLAWVRTGIAIVGLGFLVSRFGLFLNLMLNGASTRTAHYDKIASSVLGIAFVVVGAIAIAAAAWQHGRFIATLPDADRPAVYSRTWALWITGLVALASLALAVYLVLTLQ